MFQGSYRRLSDSEIDPPIFSPTWKSGTALLVLCCVGLLAGSAPAQPPAVEAESVLLAEGDSGKQTNDGDSSDEKAWQTATEFMDTYCLDCHQGEGAEADFDLDEYRSITLIAQSRKQWRKLLSRVRDHEMPPRDAEQPQLETREEFVQWLEQVLKQAACGQGVSPARAVTRRLNRNEYANTVRDLFGIHVNVALILPNDGAGGEGFDNAAETLTISPVHAEKYLEAARTALEHALQGPDSRARLIPQQPGSDDDNGSSPAVAARIALTAFLQRAFRRDVAPEEVEAYHEIFETSFGRSGVFTDSLKSAMTAAMLSPHFLFRVEAPVDAEHPIGSEQSVEMVPLDDFELASRLSYFLWASMPDDELLAAAREGKLQDDAELKRQMTRMLSGGKVGRASNRVGGFAQSFIEQWLGTRALGREFKPDPKVAKRYTSELEGGMKYEPVLFFEDILVNNLSVLNCIEADFTYANKSLARHYGIKGEFREQPRRVELKAGGHRGGFLSMASVLAISSYPHRTSPVLRGKWILETLLGAPPPPPPADVPELDEEVNLKQPKTLRDKLELHRERSECAVCHDRIDPLGFGLSNYDVLGKYRLIDGGKFINNRGQLPDGTEFRGPQGLKQALLARKDQFAEHLTAKMMGFALGRGLRDEDYCVVSEIVEELKADEYRAHALIWGIVRSVPFRYKSGAR